MISLNYFRRPKSRSSSASTRCVGRYLIGTRTAVLPGFWPCRWSNEGVAENIIDVGGVIAVIPAV